ncbi:DUF2911 domain-containing protein [Hymenobacter sp. BT188]|uniref:DUF2911 domain-containing protein n=1 Tax=Hymenobacter sp. BT188 TaxID=2763504 RepID=UPI0016510507|nr:DUF2911 domain-containing protein [Hymenobacter sp. BT188]MBC6607491.1 DUF2911 domain-containing protein [Hymenobacter sp. BT188]
MKPRVLLTIPFLSVACLLGSNPYAQAQQALQIPVASPAVRIRQDFSASFVELSYSRPSKKGREIFGKLEPYGQVWRTGANTNTKIRFGEEVKFGGQTVPAGTYALFSIPGPKEWTLILNRDTAQWGAYRYKPEMDVVRVKAIPTTLRDPAETMSLTLENLKPSAADLTLRWDKTQVSVPLTGDSDAQVEAQIAQAMQGEKKPYISAAQYYYNNNKDLNKALTWLDAAIKQQPSYYAYYWKARVLQKSKRPDEATAAAKQSLELVKAEKTPSIKEEYIRLNQQLLADIGSKK